MDSFVWLSLYDLHDLLSGNFANPPRGKKHQAGTSQSLSTQRGISTSMEVIVPPLRYLYLDGGIIYLEVYLTLCSTLYSLMFA